VATVAVAVLGYVAVFRPEAFSLLPIAAVEVAGVKVVLREKENGEIEVTAVGTNDKRVKSWLETKVQLEARLGFLVKHFFPLHDQWLAPGRVPGSPYANFGTMTYDGYLSEADVAIVFRFGSLSQTDLALLDRKELDSLLSDAASLTKSIRKRVFAGFLMRYLKSRGDLAVTTGDRGVLTVKAPMALTLYLAPVFYRRSEGKVGARRISLAKQTEVSIHQAYVVLPRWEGGGNDGVLEAPTDSRAGLVSIDRLDELLTAPNLGGSK
jgi:hypothetical protein